MVRFLSSLRPSDTPEPNRIASNRNPRSLCLQRTAVCAKSIFSSRFIYCIFSFRVSGMRRNRPLPLKLHLRQPNFELFATRSLPPRSRRANQSAPFISRTNPFTLHRSWKTVWCNWTRHGLPSASSRHPAPFSPSDPPWHLVSWKKTANCLWRWTRRHCISAVRVAPQALRSQVSAAAAAF